MLIPTSSRDYGAPPASRGVNNNKSAGSSYSSAFPSSSPPRHQRTMSDTIQYTPVDPIPAANAAASSSRSKCDEPLKTLQPSNHNNNSSSSQNSINSPTSKPGSFAQSITSSNSVASGGGGTQYTSIVSQLQQEQRKELLLQQQQLEPSPINPMTPSSSASAAAANSDYMVMTPTDSGIDDHPPPGSLPRFGNEYEMMSPVSVNPGRLESTRRSGVAIVPSSSSSNTASTSVGSLNNALPPVAPVTPAAPYNVISPKSGIEESNPPSSLPSPTPLSAIEERLGGPGGSTAASTTSSSVEGGARPKTSSSFSAASGAASASSSRSQSSLSSAQHKRSSFFSSASMTAPDRTTTDVGGGGSGAGASGRCSSPSWDPLPFDGPPTSSYPSDPVQDQRQLDYVPIDYSHSTSRISAGAIPIPMASALGSRMSPASSSSLVSGTPNSTESRFPAEFQLESKSISYLRDDDDELDEPPAIPANANQPPLQPYSLAHHHHSKSNSNASSTTGGSRSRTGSISRFIDIPGTFGFWSLVIYLSTTTPSDIF